MGKTISQIVQPNKPKINDPYAKPLYELEKIPRTDLRFSQLYYLSQKKFDKDDGFLLECAMETVVRDQLNALQLRCERAFQLNYLFEEKINRFEKDFG